MNTNPVDSDDDGNPLALPDPGTPVGQLIYLLEWARVRGFVLGPTIQIGDLVLQVRDLRQTEGKGLAPPDLGPWKAAGYDGE